MFKKYSITALFSLLLIFTAFTGGGFAQTPETVMTPEIADALADVEKVNEKIYTEIVKTQDKAEKMYAKYLTDKAEAKDAEKQAEALIEYNSKIEAEITKLQEKAKKITLKGIEKAQAAGLKVEIELVSMKFADRERDIDPIKVIGW